MDYKKTKAPASTITRDIQTLEKGTNNIYESIAIIAKRADLHFKSDTEKAQQIRQYAVDRGGILLQSQNE